MAEFEELRLTVNLVDNASQGLANLRREVQLLTQSAGNMGVVVNNTSQQLTNFGRTSQTVSQQTRELNAQMRQLTMSGQQLGQGIGQLSAAFQGLRGLPQIAGGLYEMQAGLRGVNQSMLALGASSRIAIVGIGAVGLAVLGVGALFTAAMVAAFKFSREIREMSVTAKTLGLSFADLKNATDQAEKFGMAASTVVQNMAGLQRLQADLYSRGSNRRAELIAKGVEPEFLERLARMTDEVERHNFVRQKLIETRAARRAEGATAIQAQGIMNDLARDLGDVDPRIADQPARAPLTADERARLAAIEAQAERVEKLWAEINKKSGELKLAFMEMFGETLMKTLREIKDIMDFAEKASKKISEYWDATKRLIDSIKNAFGGGAATPAPSTPGAPATPGEPGSWDEWLKKKGLRPASFGGDNDNDNAVGIIRQGTFEALIQFSAYSAGGGAAGGGFMNANLTPGGGPAAPATPGRGQSGFGSPQFPSINNDIVAPSGGGRGTGGKLTPEGRGRIQSWYDFLTKPVDQGGLGRTHEQALGEIASLQGESGINLNPRAWNPNDRGMPSGGTAQWRAGRLAELQKDPNWQTVESQQRHYRKEMLGSENAANAAIARSGTAAQATAAHVSRFERPQFPGPEANKRSGNIGVNRGVIDRSIVDRANSGGQITATGKLDVNVNAPPGTSVEASGTGPFTNVETTRQTQMLPAMIGPNAQAW